MEQTEWVMPLKDGTVVKIPSDKMANINKKIANRESINIADRTILFTDIASGPKLYVPEPLEPDVVEGAAKAFNSPIVNEYGEVVCVWVKETVSANRWNKYYSQFSCYYKLGNSYDNVVIAYRIPVHNLLVSAEKCNPSEVQTLELKLANS